jgi:hypothetical protein
MFFEELIFINTLHLMVYSNKYMLLLMQMMGLDTIQSLNKIEQLHENVPIDNFYGSKCHSFSTVT